MRGAPRPKRQGGTSDGLASSPRSAHSRSRRQGRAPPRHPARPRSGSHRVAQPGAPQVSATAERVEGQGNETPPPKGLSMRALTWQGKRDVRVETVPDPKIE